MNIRASLLSIISILTVAAALIAVGMYSPAQASHQKTVTIPSDYNRQDCTGPTCTFIATWADRDHDGVAIIEAIVTTNVFALEFGIENAAGDITTSLQPGESFTVPIDASGEIIGHAGRFDDSPPVTFQSGGTLHAETQGLEPCGFSSGSISEGAHTASKGCKTLQLAGNEDVLGSWTDSWSASQPGVTCTTRTDGTVADCTSTEAVTGSVTVTLTRTVDGLTWQNYDSHGLRAVPVIALSSTQNPDPLQCCITGGQNASVQNPFPGVMTSSVQVTFGETTSPAPGTPECSDTIDNDGDGTIDCEDIGCWIDQRDATTCDPTDPSEANNPSPQPPVFRETD